MLRSRLKSPNGDRRRAHRRAEDQRARQAERGESTPAPAAPRASGEEPDRAFYTCACGFVFTAGVTTTVACPHCGAHQAW